MKLAEHPRIGCLTVRKVLSKIPIEPWSVDAGTLAIEALRMINEFNVGALMVVGGNPSVGLFSERIFLSQIVLGKRKSEQASVGSLMTPCTFSVTPQQTAEECLAAMRETKTHFLPVLEDGQAVGLLSLDALLQAIVTHQERVFTALELDLRILFLQGTYSC